MLIMWIIFALPISVAAILVLAGQLWGISLPAVSLFILALGLKEIPASPPHVGVLTIWGRRIEREWWLLRKVPREGLKLVAPYFPLLIDFILINVEKKNKRMTFENIRCLLRETEESGVELQSGGEVASTVEITFVPDQDRLNSYIDSGQEGGVTDIIQGALGEDIRQTGSKRTWVEMTFGKDRLTAILITKLTGLEIPRVSLDPRTGDPQRDPETGRLMTEPGKHIDAENATLIEVDHFIKKALTNGVADIYDLGVKISRLNVVVVEPLGELKKAAERAAVEWQQREAELLETRAVCAMAEVYVEKSKKINGKSTLSFEEGLKCARIEREKAQQVYIETGGGSALPIINLPQNT